MLREEELVWRKEISKNEWKEEGARMEWRREGREGGRAGGRDVSPQHTSESLTAREKDCRFAGGLLPSPLLTHAPQAPRLTNTIPRCAAKTTPSNDSITEFGVY